MNDDDFRFEEGESTPSFNISSADDDADSDGYDSESGAWYGEPWEQQPGEPDRWFQAFHMYLTLGPTRSLPRAYRLFHQKSTGQVIATGYWAEKAFLWGWEIRARAWDHYHNTQDRDAYTHEQLEARLLRRQSLEDFFQKFYQRLDDLDGQDMSWRTAGEVFDKLARNSRDEFGDSPSTKAEVTVNVNLTIELGDILADIFAQVNNLPTPQERQNAFLSRITDIQKRLPGR